MEALERVSKRDTRDVTVRRVPTGKPPGSNVAERKVRHPTPQDGIDSPNHLSHWPGPMASKDLLECLQQRRPLLAWRRAQRHPSASSTLLHVDLDLQCRQLFPQSLFHRRAQPDLLAQPSRHPCLRIREVDPLGANTTASTPHAPLRIDERHAMRGPGHIVPRAIPRRSHATRAAAVLLVFAFCVRGDRVPTGRGSHASVPWR
jgi:hypothetical protein